MHAYVVFNTMLGALVGGQGSGRGEGKTITDITWVIPGPANGAILDASVKYRGDRKKSGNGIAPCVT